MDRSIPRTAAMILDFIRDTETGSTGPESYRTIYGHNESKLPVPITQMTLAEIQKAQTLWSKRYGSSATGGYQFMRSTLKGLITDLGLSPASKLDPNLQDRLGFHLLIRRGYQQFVTGTLSAKEFAKNLAKEWASFPVLENTRGAHRMLQRGQSYYAGDGQNKALVAPEKIEALLAAVMRERQRPQREAETQLQQIEKPAMKSTTNWVSALVGAAGSVATFFSGLDPMVQMALIAFIALGALYIIYERQGKTSLASGIREQLKDFG